MGCKCAHAEEREGERREGEREREREGRGGDRRGKHMKDDLLFTT